MPVVKITGQGLSAIALSVALLWYCFLAERAIARRAEAERAQAIQEIHRLRQRPAPLPVSTPPRPIAPAKPALG